MTELVKAQTELKAPKSQFNSFGKYFYRNCEDILEALKPLEKELNCFTTLSDELVLIGSELAVKSTATFTHADTGKNISASAFAVVDLNKKGMDRAQATGAASSYARKYALNGLFAIDDSKDSDSAPSPQKAAPQSYQPAVQLTSEQLAEISELLASTNTDLGQFLAYFGASELIFVPYNRARDALLKKMAKIGS